MTVQAPHVKAEGLVESLIDAFGAAIVHAENCSISQLQKFTCRVQDARAALLALIEHQAKQIAEKDKELDELSESTLWLDVATSEHLTARVLAEAKYTNLLAESATIKIRADRLESEKEAAETRVAELEGSLDNVAAAIGSVRFMDPPDGGDVSLSEQVRRMRVALEVAERSCR